MSHLRNYYGSIGQWMGSVWMWLLITWVIVWIVTLLGIVLIWVLGLVGAVETGGASTLPALFATPAATAIFVVLMYVGIVIALWFFLLLALVLLDCLLNFLINLFDPSVSGAWDKLWEDLSECFDNAVAGFRDGVVDRFQKWWKGATDPIKKGWDWVKSWLD